MPPFVTVAQESPENVTLTFGGAWLLKTPFKNKADIFAVLPAKKGARLTLHAQDIDAWDSSLVAFLVDILTHCRRRGVTCASDGFPDGVTRLIALALTVPAKKTALTQKPHYSVADKVGLKTLQCLASVRRSLDFMKECGKSLGRLLNEKAVMRHRDFFKEMQDAGVAALPIVSLISFMVGLILAFVGAVQLKMFGAQIFVASLVAIAMSRVMGAIMTGILMAGRTGASYAATLGAMQTNEEIDALETLGVSPYDFLVLPRLLALFLMMPLLTVYADLMSIMGGAFVGVFMLDLTPAEYFDMTLKSLSTKNIVIGLIHSTVFGIIVALSGCYFGMKSERSASAVGTATTSAVVYAIVWIIVATAIITFICSAMGV